MCDTTSPEHPEYLVGAYYFAGWWRDKPNKWSPYGREWLLDYPERRPLLGMYNEQETMDREILTASEYGVNFFQILYYPQEGINAESGQEHLNDGLSTFMASKHAHRMKFTVEYVNHTPFEITSDDVWESTCRKWCEAMRHPSYLKVGGRPVFKVHSIHHFYIQCGEDIAQMRDRLSTLRRIARESGLKDPLIGGGVGGKGVPTGEIVEPYDFLCAYMDMPQMPAAEKPHPYEKLIRYAQEGWMGHAIRGEKHYIPYVPSGWDPRPWRDPRPPFAMPTRDEWRSALQRVQVALDKYPMLGIPTPGGTQKALLIYAWNEFGEGGMLAPTEGQGMMKLEVIREVFGAGGMSRPLQ